MKTGRFRSGSSRRPSQRMVDNSNRWHGPIPGRSESHRRYAPLGRRRGKDRAGGDIFLMIPFVQPEPKTGRRMKWSAFDDRMSRNIFHRQLSSKRSRLPFKIVERLHGKEYAVNAK